MCQPQYDLTYSDFNPTVLFASKMHITEDTICHMHNDFTELTIILSGKCRYVVDGKTYEAEAGDILICNPGVSHQGFLSGTEETSVQFFTGFSDYQLRNLPPNTIQLREGSHLLRMSTESRREVQKHCFEMVAENEACQLGKYFMLKAHLMQIVLLMIREITEYQGNRQSGYNFENYNKSYAVKRIINYLNENYESKISLDQIAHNMYLSPVYISKIFKEETGESPINYLIKIRLEKAKEILEGSKGGSIKDIANEVGYDDAYHFSKLFKKYYGVSPLNYKKGCFEKNA